MTAITLNLQRTAFNFKIFFLLCKPRVTSLIVFTAVIGMFLAEPGMPSWALLLPATLGIALVSGAAAAFNCLIEQKIDAVMARTRARPLPRGEVNNLQTILFASVIGGAGLSLLYFWVNPLTAWLTLATFFGYAVIYTVLLKPATPLNIVIGGASGAMPPLLGWAAMSGSISGEALILFLIIFAWTPPHFWALALYRRDEYAKAGVPMLPVTHGEEFTRLHILLYTIILVTITVMPYTYGMSGLIYLAAAVVLDAGFLYYAVRLYLKYSDALSRQTFRYSITYLSLLFAALLLDHYFKF